MKLLVFLLFALVSRVSAEGPSAEAMKAALPGLTGKARLVALLDLVNKIESREPQEALILAAEGRSLAQREGDPEREASFLCSTSFCYSQTGDFALALQAGRESLELSRRINNKERIAKAYNVLGITHTFMGLYSQALEEHLESLRIREELSLETASIQSLNNIGILYHNMGQYEKAIYYYQKILERISQKPDSSRLILIKLNIGFAETKLGRLDEALKQHLEAMDLIARNDNKTLNAYAHFNLGLTYTDLKQFDKARHFLEAALVEYGSQDQKHGRVQVLNALGRLNMLTGAYAKAIPRAAEAAQLAQKINARNELIISYELLSDLYMKQGNLAESFKYYKSFVATKDTIYTTQESNKIADASMKIVSLRKDNEIDSLRKEQLISRLKLEKVRYASFILVSSLVFMVAIVLTLVAYNNKIRNNKRLLESTNTELERLNAELHDKIHEVKTLSGLLPICSQCKKIRNDSGYWEQLEGYISQHTTATFTHGICPNCADAIYPGMGHRKATGTT